MALYSLPGVRTEHSYLGIHTLTRKAPRLPGALQKAATPYLLGTRPA